MDFLCRCCSWTTDNTHQVRAASAYREGGGTFYPSLHQLLPASPPNVTPHVERPLSCFTKPWHGRRMWAPNPTHLWLPARKTHGVISDSHKPLKFQGRKFTHYLGTRIPRFPVLRIVCFHCCHQETIENPSG